jgi:agmatine deiminase
MPAAGCPGPAAPTSGSTASQTPHSMFSRSYVNFYIANGGIVMPRFGVPADSRARDVVQAAFPDREIVQIDIPLLASGGGGIHCITQQQPA